MFWSNPRTIRAECPIAVRIRRRRCRFDVVLLTAQEIRYDGADSECYFRCHFCRCDAYRSKYPKLHRTITGITQAATNIIIGLHPIRVRAFRGPPTRLLIILYRCNEDVLSEPISRFATTPLERSGRRELFGSSPLISSANDVEVARHDDTTRRQYAFRDHSLFHGRRSVFLRRLAAPEKQCRRRRFRRRP
jgi:hypothetical protein